MMKAPDCDDYDLNMLTVAAALQRIDHNLRPIVGEEQVAIRSALGRILAENILSPVNVPPHNKSAMDGYAVLGTDLPRAGQVQLTIVGTSWAGKPYPDTITTGQCARILTGAVMPTGTDTVIMQEQVEKQGDIITFSAGHRVGQHVCMIGEDLQVGQPVLTTSKKLSPADIGLLATLGIPEVKVKRRLRVAFFSTGDELASLGEVLQLGQIYDSNRYTLYSMLSQLDVEMMDMGVVRDNPSAIETALLAAAATSDAIITSGGVSVGDADYVTETLRRLGEINFWKIAMKPGKPLTFGKIQAATFFGLPGNPVSAMVTFYQFVQPALQRLMGQDKTTPLRLKVPCISPLKKRPGRLEFQRGILEPNEQGHLVVRSTGNQGSALLSSMSQANCFIILPLDCGEVAVGTEVLVEPLV
jgi:molybdopterin molybdotransferase